MMRSSHGRPAVIGLLIGSALLALQACEGPVSQPPSEKKEVGAMKIEVTSTAFREGGVIPTKHTGDGPDLSPPLSLGSVPEGTRSLALICDDPDAPVGTWVHWVIFGIPPGTTSLGEGVPTDEVLADGAKQGRNDFGRIGYGGPAPPPGPAHRYFFKVYALDSEIPIEAGATKADLEKAMEGHIIGEGRLMGKYQRG